MDKYKQFQKDMAPILQYQHDYDENIKALGIIYKESFVTPYLGTNLLDAYILLLEEKYNDKNKWISYFVWECDLGKKPQDIYIDDIPVITLNSLERLYSIITKKYGDTIR